LRKYFHPGGQADAEGRLLALVLPVCHSSDWRLFIYSSKESENVSYSIMVTGMDPPL